MKEELLLEPQTKGTTIQKKPSSALGGGKAMSYLPDYITWRGDLPFAADPANDLDTLVMAALSYIDLPAETQVFAQCAKSVPPDDPDDHFRGECRRLLQQIAKSSRFGALTVRDAVSVLNDEIQFAAMTVDLPDGTHIIAFRGTDGSPTGWREDFAMSFESPVPAQAAAQKYLERHLTQDAGDVIVTGHSKGGNLAVYAAAHTKADLQGRIRRVVSFDGPGVDDETAASDGFYANAIMVAAYYGFVALVLALAFYLDTRRAFAFKNKPSEICLANEKQRWAVYYALVIALLAGYIMQSGGFGSSGFGMYAGF